MPVPPATTHLAELAELVHHLEPPGPFAVGLRCREGAVALVVRRLDPGDPVLALAGFRAPPDWDAFAVRTSDASSPGSPSTVHVVSRRGTAHTDGAGPPPGIADTCHRVLGLATAPPSTSTADLLAAFWLDAVLGLILDADVGDPAPDWPRCRALLGPLGDEPLGLLGARVARHVSWADVHRWATTRSLCGIPCATADWFDVGSYSRFVLGLYGPHDEVRADVGELLAPSTAGALRSVLDQWPLTPDR